MNIKPQTKQFKSPGIHEMEILVWLIQHPNQDYTCQQITDGIQFLKYSHVHKALMNMMHVVEYDEKLKLWRLNLTLRTLPSELSVNRTTEKLARHRRRSIEIFDYFMLNLPLYLNHAYEELETGRSMDFIRPTSRKGKKNDIEPIEIPVFESVAPAYRK